MESRRAINGILQGKNEILHGKKWDFTGRQIEFFRSKNWIFQVEKWNFSGRKRDWNEIITHTICSLPFIVVLFIEICLTFVDIGIHNKRAFVLLFQFRFL